LHEGVENDLSLLLIYSWNTQEKNEHSWLINKVFLLDETHNLSSVLQLYFLFWRIYFFGRMLPGGPTYTKTFLLKQIQAKKFGFCSFLKGWGII